MKTKDEEQDLSDKPPVLKSWKRIYFLVLLNLAVTIIIFYLITRYFQ